MPGLGINGLIAVVMIVPSIGDPKGLLWHLLKLSSLDFSAVIRASLIKWMQRSFERLGLMRWSRRFKQMLPILWKVCKAV